MSTSWDVYTEVKGNFQRVEEYGWFHPGHSKVLNFEPNYTNQSRLGYRLAAVLFLITFYKGDFHVLLTKRSDKVTTHKGEDSLPGGLREPADSTPAETALREAHEEVNLDPMKVDVISILPPFVSGLSFLTAVTPVVCVLKCDPQELQLAPNAEVTSIYWIPLKIFFQAKNMELVRYTWQNRAITQCGFHYTEPETKSKHFIWGLTWGICATSSCIALNRPPITNFYHGVADVISKISNGGRETVVYRMVVTSDDIRKWESHKGKVDCCMFLKQWPKATTASNL